MILADADPIAIASVADRIRQSVREARKSTPKNTSSRIVGKVEHMLLDMMWMESITAFVHEFDRRDIPLNVLVNCPPDHTLSEGVVTTTDNNSSTLLLNAIRGVAQRRVTQNGLELQLQS